MFKDKFIEVCRAHGLALTTERSYWDAARKHIAWMKAKSAKDLEKNPTQQFRDYLSAMANENETRYDGDEGVSASTQNLAFHSLRFLYEQVVGVCLGDLSKIPRIEQHERIVDVPDDDTARKLVNVIPGVCGLAIRLIYGTGARLNDITRLRVKDLDFNRKLVAIQCSKGGKARLARMPESLIHELAMLAKRREAVHESDLASGFGFVHLPGKLAVKYPGEEKSLGWQYLFALKSIGKDPRSGKLGRWHIFDTTLQRAMIDARKKLRLRRRYTIHSLRHSWAQFQERQGMPRSEIQVMLGHSSSRTTDRYLLSGSKGIPKTVSPI